MAIVPVALLTFTSRGLQPIVDASADVKLLLVYVGIGCTAINFVLWYYGLKYLSAAAASAFQYLIPPVAVAIAVVFLGEQLSTTLVLGTVCIVVGLVTTQLASIPRARLRHAARGAR